MDDLVSIIIPVYNGEKTILRTISSCLEQDFKNIEILVIDNASIDQTEKIVQGIEDSRVHYVHLDQKGRSFARNEGIKLANGHYIQFLDADDTLEEDKISYSVAYLREHLDVTAITLGIHYISEEHQLLNTIMPQMHYEHELLAHNIFPIHSPLIRNENLGEFPLNLDYCEDWLFWVETLYGKKIFCDQEKIGGTVFVHRNNTMGDTKKMSEYELIVQQMLKKKYPIRNKQLKRNELILLVFHYFNDRKEKVANDIVSKNSAITYFFVKILCQLPIIGSRLKNKAIACIDANIFD